MPETEAGSSPEAKPLPRLGSYLLTKQLGSGGMSNVFRAVHEESKSVVAVKVLPRSLAKNVTLLQRFIREAKSAEALDHPNIVSIFDRGFDQGRHYLVLEFVEGRDLHDRVRINGPMQIEEAIRVVREVAEGLRYAAGRGMIHRDIKPANLLITPEGHAKIIDLGLALQTGDEDERVTRDGTTVGTVDYMAPEQARDSRKTSERSDIYSLGCTFHYLLTGSPPFPGGGLADKLSRHHSAPPPDVRNLRPEVPEPLALLVRKMMAKKPEGRFVAYSQLIEALDHVGDPVTPATSLGPFDVLIDDEDDDETFGLALTDPDPSRAGLGNAEPTIPYLMAEIVDDEEDEPPRPPSTVPLARTGASKSPPARRPEVASTGDFSLAELAGLDADGASTAPSKLRRPPSTPVAITPTPRSAGPSMDALIDEEDEEADELLAGVDPTVRRGGQELPLKTWIFAGLFVGLAIAVVGLGVSLVLSLNRPAEPEPVVVTTADPEPSAEPDVTSPILTPRPRGPKPGPVRPPSPTRKDEPARPGADRVATPIPIGPGPEKTYPREWEDRLLPKPLTTETLLLERPRTVVRRLAEPGDDPQTSSLSAALAKVGDLVEIADNGPFYEDDLQVVGKSRVVRARPGSRPIIKVEMTTTPAVRDQEAKFVLGGNRPEQLILEGLDLAVDLRDLPGQQSSLFLCRGADLTLRDCSITLFNAGDRKFSVFRLLDGARPGRLTLERSTIRGPIKILVELLASRAEIVIDRSLILGEAGPVVAVEPAERPSRSLFLTRSLVATSGPLVEWTGKPSPIAVRSLGSTYARAEGGPVVGLFHTRSMPVGGPTACLDWSGEDDEFVGWPAWLSSATLVGGAAESRIGNLAAVRQTWPGTDVTSREATAPWHASASRFEEVTPLDFEGLATDRRATLARIAAPHPRIRDLAIEQVKRLPTPGLAVGLVNTSVPLPLPPVVETALTPAPVPTPPKTPVGPRMAEGDPRGGGIGAGPLGPSRPPPKLGSPGRPASPTIMAIDATFDVQAAPWNGDLGRFLAETVKGPGGRAVVRVRGGGVHVMSPVRLPDGVSVAILGESAEGSRLPMPTFTPSPDSPGRPLIDSRGGDLALSNIAFASDGGIRPKHWVQVDDGILAVRHCKFRDMGGADPAVGAAIAFHAPGSVAIPARAGPLKSPTDYPTARLLNCLIWTGGDAVAAELGRGVIELDNCLVISGGPAFTLQPGKVAREKFEADLVLERCTIADDRNAITFGPWSGDPAGPSRPWLIATRSCVFPRTQREGNGAAMLLVDPDAFARGAVTWQSAGDAYDISRFLASSGAQSSTAPPPPDIKRQWVDLWGAHHTRNDRGPDPRRSEHFVRYKDKDRPRPGKVTPLALELDPKVPAMNDLGVELKDLPSPPAR